MDPQGRGSPSRLCGCSGASGDRGRLAPSRYCEPLEICGVMKLHRQSERRHQTSEMILRSFESVHAILIQTGFPSPEIRFESAICFLQSCVVRESPNQHP